MPQKFTNITTYIIILFFIVVFLVGIYYVAGETKANSNAELDNDSIIYITSVQTGIDIDELAEQYGVTSEEMERAILINENFSQGSPKDQGLEYLFAKEKGFGIENTIKRIYNFPTFLVGTILRLPINNWKHFINIIVWFLSIMIGIALINYVRKGSPDR